VIYHLAVGNEKTFPGAFMSAVVTTRNLLDAALKKAFLKRFVNVSSFAVYSNMNIPRGGILDESCELETRFMERYEAYTFGKAKQDEIVREYGSKHGIPYVIVRPGAVFGPEDRGLTDRVGIDTFGFFLHLGGSIRLPLTYVDNCAEAIVLAGIVDGVDGEVFNVVDDGTPTSREFLRMYKKRVRFFRSIYLPYPLFYGLCALWEKYSRWSGGQLPPAFNRRRCAAVWKGNRYPNEKLKRLLGWTPKVSYDEGVRRLIDFARKQKEAEA
jgi:nucleoside-diphosphate-sugar epimerase